MLETDRLFLRKWQLQDRIPFFHLNSDPIVMEFMPKTLSRIESDTFADKIEEHFHKHGFGLFACEHKEDKAFIGFVGLSVPRFTCDFTPCVEIGWRLAKAYWKKGLATEAAIAVLNYAKDVLHLQKVVSFTVPNNFASRRVMEKIGMTYIQDFLHPSLDVNSPLAPHVLYTIEFYCFE